MGRNNGTTSDRQGQRGRTLLPSSMSIKSSLLFVGSQERLRESFVRLGVAYMQGQGKSESNRKRHDKTRTTSGRVVLGFIIKQT